MEQLKLSDVELTRRVWQEPCYFLAFGFGTGLLPFAPGTWGTLAAIPLYLLLTVFSPTLYLIITIIFFFIGVHICSKVTDDLGKQDYSGIVWDEIVGLLLTLFHAPVTITWIITGFVLFRFFDILKPQPIRYVDTKIKGGLGIMLDDVLAAIPAWLIMQILIRGFAG